MSYSPSSFYFLLFCAAIASTTDKIAEASAARQMVKTFQSLVATRASLFTGTFFSLFPPSPLDENFVFASDW
jgi:hypothetical protein